MSWACVVVDDALLKTKDHSDPVRRDVVAQELVDLSDTRVVADRARGTVADRPHIAQALSCVTSDDGSTHPRPRSHIDVWRSRKDRVVGTGFVLVAADGALMATHASDKRVSVSGMSAPMEPTPPLGVVLSIAPLDRADLHEWTACAGIDRRRMISSPCSWLFASMAARWRFSRASSSRKVEASAVSPCS